MLVCRRLLLIAAAIAASIEAGSTSYYPSISSSDYSGYPNGGYAVHSGATSPESSPSSSSSTSGPTSELAASNTESVCRPSEFRCSTTGHCVAQDKYCDGENDCDDKSDEPRYCTPCNRTLYGDVGRTYRVEIRRPREDRLPFLCHLNFTAAGSDLGDLVQVGHRNDVVVENNADWCPVGVRSLSWSRQRAASRRSPDNNLYPGFYDSYRVYWRN
ncbi:hypothetical protein ALC56_14780 [Trachymyrmex septentrionalis]|uniref:Low-density lipoprotein receptor-related protein 2 n=1 Tax=Trachymyrmex septentrionalis TaxID=34720 RepID=A0A195ERW5_9HYME|nr:hypothetical protein ALC56_14780 [Trachymyrmex septentrionalis]